MEGVTSIIEHFAACLPSFWGLNISSLKGIVTDYVLQRRKRASERSGKRADIAELKRDGIRKQTQILL